MLLSNRVAVVTGATRGIGRAAAERFAAEGAAVIGVYNGSVEAAERFERDMTAGGHRVRLFRGSVADRAFVADLMARTYDGFGRIDVLVNNAGITRDGLALTMSQAQWSDVFRTNYVGTAACCEEAIPYLIRSGGGRIVNVVSASAVYGREAQANYAASKGAVIGLTKLLARRYAAQGIAVNAVAPGMIETDMTAAVPEESMRLFLQHTHLGRAGSPDEAAASILYLASSLSGYVSGQVLRADGGFLS